MQPSNPGFTRKRAPMSFKGVESRTKQSFRDSTSVDAVLRKYATIGGEVSDIGALQRRAQALPYGVQDMVLDYQGQFNAVKAVEEYFRSLPAQVREYLGDSMGLIDFLKDPANRAKAVELGILPKPEIPAGSARTPPPPPPPAAPPAAPPAPAA